jgi:hypothetical protein
LSARTTDAALLLLPDEDDDDRLPLLLLMPAKPLRFVVVVDVRAGLVKLSRHLKNMRLIRRVRAAFHSIFFLFFCLSAST